jgi:hypothetical protein
MRMHCEKATQNPIASLILVIGSGGRVQDVLNIEPVIPVRVSKN